MRALFNSRSIPALALTLFAMLAAAGLFDANAESATRYFYDARGQLVRVVAPSGISIEYVYDATGNRIEVRRTEVTELTIFEFTPDRGVEGASVTIEGWGFSDVPAENAVDFGGTPANVQTATFERLVVTVPPGAITGPITVTVGTETATTEDSFVVIRRPVVTGIAPTKALAGTTRTDFMVVGANLTDSSFAFLPESTPPNYVISRVATAADGSSATFDVSFGLDAAGVWILVATNVEGSSDTVPTESNTLVFVHPDGDEDMDGLTNGDERLVGTDFLNRDTDGDGFWDGAEVSVGTSPLNAASVPWNTIAARPGLVSVTVPGTGSTDQYELNTIAARPGRVSVTVPGTGMTDEFELNTIAARPGLVSVTVPGAGSTDQYELNTIAARPGLVSVTVPGAGMTDEFELNTIAARPGLVTIEVEPPPTDKNNESERPSENADEKEKP